MSARVKYIADRLLLREYKSSLWRRLVYRYDEHDDVEKDIVKTGRDSYIVRCNTELEDMFEYFHKELPESESNTVAGWVMELFGEIPKRDDEMMYENLLISVLKTDNRRVEQIRVRVLPNETADNREE